MSKNVNKRFNEEPEYRLHRIKHFAKKYGWLLLSSEDELIFANKEASLRIDIKTLTIYTELTHPKKGETILKRTGSFNQKLIEKIFRNPRVHMPPQIQSEYPSFEK